MVPLKALNIYVKFAKHFLGNFFLGVFVQLTLVLVFILVIYQLQLTLAFVLTAIVVTTTEFSPVIH